MEKINSILTEDLVVVSVLSFVSGVFIASFVYFGIGITFFILFLGIIIFLYKFRLPVSLRKIFIALSLIFIFFSFGVFRFEVHNNTHIDREFISQIGKQISFESLVLNEPTVRDKYVQYIVATPSKNENVLVRASLYPRFKYGDRVKWSGTLKLPENFESGSGATFDYVSYLRKDNISYILSYAKGELISNGEGNFLIRNLLSVKEKFLKNVQRIVPEPQSSLLAGILLGVDSMNTNQEEAFRNTGIIHIVVLSGYNITIVSENIVKIFSFLPQNFAISAGAIGIILFALMVGAGPSVLRASIMALMALLARATGRKYEITRALLIAGFLMILWNPNILVSDVGFELSFLATMALIWISPLVEERIRFVPEKWNLREITSATISTQIFVLPLILYKMGTLSLVGLPVNLLVLQFIPLTMLFGFLTGLFGFVSIFIAMPFGFISKILLSYIFKVVDIFNSFSFAAKTIEHFPAILMWITYIFYAWLYWRLNNKSKIDNKKVYERAVS